MATAAQALQRKPGEALVYPFHATHQFAPIEAERPLLCFQRRVPMLDLIFVLLILASYAATHLLICGLAKLGRIQ